MTSTPDRQHILALVNEAVQNGAGEERACKELGLSARTLRRWRREENGGADRRPLAERPKPAHAFSQKDWDAIDKTLNSGSYQSMAPSYIVMDLADHGVYLGSESSFYRLMRARGQAKHRGNARPPRPSEPAPRHIVTDIHQLWVWDITWMPSSLNGAFFKLYTLMDLFSRFIVGWEVWEEENADRARELLDRTFIAESLTDPTGLVVHGDNGGPFRAHTVHGFMYAKGVTPSHSRPYRSNDNAHMEAFYRSVKYQPSLPPEGFNTLEEVRRWSHNFIQWYNHHHKHRALNFVTPYEKHNRLDARILNRRKAVFEHARKRNPAAWTRKHVRDFRPVTQTNLNQQKEALTKQQFYKHYA